jgi:iron complex outermembrane recepter protein
MNKRSFLFSIALIIGFIFALGDISALLAQETSSEEFTLEEITVTAQKRSENQQRVPIAMETISAAEMQELGRNDLDDILTNVSNVIVQKAADGMRVSLRGISDDSSSFMGQSMAAPTVAINTDGVYSNRKDTGSFLYDLERVEVLYGPQSTMYSSNSPGGIVNVVTAQPKTDKFEVNASLEVGNYNLIQIQGAVNVPLSSMLAFRAAFSSVERDGYLDTGGEAENAKSGRLRVLFQLTDKITFTPAVEYTKDKGVGTGGGVKAFVHQDDEYYPDGTPLEDPWTSNVGAMDNAASNDAESWKYSGNFVWDMNFMTMTVIPSYTEGNGERTRVMTFGGTPSITYSFTDRWEKGAEMRLTSGSDFAFKWILGGTYYDSEDKQDELSEEYLIYGTGKFSYRTNTEHNRAIFANVTVPVADTFRLTGGYRASWDEMTTDNYERTWEPSQGGWVIRDESPSQNTTAGRPDYKLGFEYDLGTNSMLFGDYSTSYRVQGMAATTEPQELKAYTLGAKNRFYDNKLQLNISAYFYDYSNYNPGIREEVWIGDLDGDGEIDGGMGGGGPPPPMSFSNGGSLVPAQGPPPSSGGTSEVAMDDGARGVTGEGQMFGIDFSADAMLTANDTATLSVSYMKSEWTDLAFIWEYPTEWVLINGVPTEVPHENVIYNGKPMQNTPPLTVNLIYNHNFPLGNGGNIKAGFNAKYQSDYRLSWNEDDYPENYQEAFYMLGANMSYNSPSGKWSLSAYGNNLTNYAEKRMYMNAGGMGQLSIGDPRTYGAVLSVRF